MRDTLWPLATLQRGEDLNSLFLDFYGYGVKLDCQSEKILSLLAKDFSYFTKNAGEANLWIKAEITQEIESRIPSGLVALKQNQRAITFEKGERRYNYFYGQAVSVMDYEKKEMRIYSKNEDYLHELLYLAILSRETKSHDLSGLHKIHAFGVAKGETALIGMMNMKGGKTTLFSYFIDQPGYEIISDDTPLVNESGEILPFPIRIGFELNSFTKDRLESYQDKSYYFEREEYGPKRLIDIQEFTNPIATKKDRVILFQGVRVHGATDAETVQISKLKMFRYLMKNLIIGMGLPMVLEYYLESGWKGRLRNLQILARRFWSAFNLLRRSACYEVRMCSVPEKNYVVVKGLLDSYAGE